MKTKLIYLACVAALFCHASSDAFDIHTHAAMTANAIRQSAIGSTPNASPILKKLGLYDKDELFGKKYIDIGSALTKRDVTTFEGEVTKALRDPPASLIIPGDNTIPGWIIRGSIREDDNTIETPSGTPQGDEPGGVFNRVYAHFYDPQNDRPLTVFVEQGPRSPDWALLAGTQASGRDNRYNIPSAREAMWRALTLKKKSPSGSLDDLTPDAGTDAKAKEDERKAYWATTFRALGDVVHLLQDAGQPQHTRNDAHSGFGCRPPVNAPDNCIAGHDSFIEKYLRARTLRANTFTLVEGVTPSLPTWELVKNTQVLSQLNYGPYTTPQFATYRDFFSTGSGNANSNGKGLANYSNRGFYSFGTNINSTSYLSPSPSGAGLTDEFLASGQAKDIAGNVVLGIVNFKTGNVQDTAFPSASTTTPVRLSTSGFFDQFLQAQNFAPRFTLNHYNYDAQADLLIPRAVAYSAGLIDYFFRGELKIALPDEGIYSIIDHADPASNCKDTCGFKKIKLKLTNTTPDIVVSGGGETKVQNMTGGTLVAVVKYSRNDCYKTDMSGEVGSDDFPATQDAYKRCLFNNNEVIAGKQFEEIVVSKPQSGSFSLSKNEEKPLTFEFDDAIPINAWNVSLQVVYRGALADENDAVVVATKLISAPTYYVFENVQDYTVIENKLYTFDQINANQVLLDKTPIRCINPVTSKLKDTQECFPKEAVDGYFESPVVTNGVHSEMGRVIGLSKGSFSRVVVLTDSESFQLRIRGIRDVDPIKKELLFTFALEPNHFAINYETNAISAREVKKSRTFYEFSDYGFINYWGSNFDADHPPDSEYRALPVRSSPQPKRLTNLSF